MAVVAPVFDKSDPKAVKLYPFQLPQTPEWEETKDVFGQAAMMGAGAGMFIKNPWFIWGSMAMAVINYVNLQPMRQNKDAQSPLFSIGMGLLGVVTINMPRLILAAEVPPTSLPVA